MQRPTAHTYVCPDCRQRVEVNVLAEVITCTKCAQIMILAKGKKESMFATSEDKPLFVEKSPS